MEMENVLFFFEDEDFSSTLNQIESKKVNICPPTIVVPSVVGQSAKSRAPNLHFTISLKCKHLR